MNRTAFSLILALFTLLLSSCTNMPQLFWPIQEGNGQSQTATTSSASSRPPLVVPPSLRGQVSVPIPAGIASGQSPQVQKLEAKEKAEVAGTAVALSTRVYDQSVAEVFSSVVDAMTQLNLPVQSVDSPSGTITTSWIRQDAGSANLFSPVLNLFGGQPNLVQYRFVVRVLRLTTPSGVKTQLEVRTLGQSFINSHWVNKPIKQKVSNDLFSAVGEQLARQATPQTQTTPAPTTAPAATPAASPAAQGAAAAPAASPSQ